MNERIVLLDFIKQNRKVPEEVEKQDILLLRCYASFAFLKAFSLEEKTNMSILEYQVLLPWVLNEKKAQSESALFLKYGIKEFVLTFTSSLIEDFDVLTDFFATWDFDGWFVASNLYLAYSVKVAFDKKKYKTFSPYEIFREGNHLREMLSKKQFDTLYRAVSGIELNPKVLVTSEKVNTALIYLKEECGFTDDDISNVIKQYAFWDSDFSPSKMNSLLMKGVKNGADLKKIKRSMELLKNPNNMLSAACKTHLTEKHDTLLENSLVYQVLYKGITAGENVIIIDPSPFFIRKWLVDENAIGIKTCFFVNKKLFPAIFRAVKEDHPDVDVVETIPSLLKACQKVSYINNRTSVLMFANHSESRNYCFDILKELMPIMDIRGVLLNGTSEIENKSSPFSRVLMSDTVAISRVILLPRDILYATDPKYKAVIEFYSLKKANKNNQKTSTRFLDYYLDKNGKYQIIQKRDQGFYAAFSEILASGVTLRNAYTRTRIENQIKDKNAKRQRAKEYVFSDEITITCAERKVEGRGIRLDAYVYGPYSYVTEEKASGTRDRRKRLEESLKTITNIEQEDIENWIYNIYPYERLKQGNSANEGDKKSVKKTVRDVIIHAYHGKLGKNISLKTFVYLNPEIDEKLSEDEIGVLRFIMNSEIGCFHFPRIEPERIKEIINNLYDDLTNNERPGNESIAYETLRIVFAEAVRQRYCVDNPFTKDIGEYEDLSFTQVRNSSLVPKHFELDEMRRIYRLSKRAMEKGKKEYIGIFLKLFLGLKTEEVCALIWEDFEKVEIPDLSEDVYRILIRRQITNDGSKYIPLPKKELYREMLCPPILYKILLEERESVLGWCTAEELSRKPIVDNEGGKNKNNRAFSPRELNKISRDIIKKLGIKDMTINVPTKYGGTKETNLSSYKGDIFRSNFEHYLRIWGKCNLGEITYLLGNKTEITFSNHYCDYGNYQSQLILFQKVKRYGSLLAQNERKRALYLNPTVEDHTVIIEGLGYDRHISELSGVIMVEKEIPEMTLKVEAEYGTDVSIERIGGRL